MIKILFVVYFILVFLLFINTFYKKKYTIVGKNDGFGSQYQAIMSGIAYCKYKNYNYVHTPFKNISHSGDKDSLNKFIGIPNLNSKNDIKIDIKEPYSYEVHKSSNPSKYYTNDTIKLLRNYYYTNPKPNIDNIDIAIHIRRGNVTSTNNFSRYTPNSYYNKIINFFNNKYPSNNIVIFSEGKIEDFNEINGKNISFKLNKSIEETFHSLVSSKILVMSKSSFSYSAAILNSNEIYYMDFWHKPLKNWKIIYNIIPIT